MIKMTINVTSAGQVRAVSTSWTRFIPYHRHHILIQLIIQSYIHIQNHVNKSYASSSPLSHKASKVLFSLHLFELSFGDRFLVGQLQISSNLSPNIHHHQVTVVFGTLLWL